MPIRPNDEEELQEKEVAGLIRASAFVRKYSRSDKPIDVYTILKVHEEIWRKARPEIAGKYRNDELKISGSRHIPAHHSEVPVLMHEADKVLKDKLAGLEGCRGVILEFSEIDEKVMDCIDKVVSAAAWIHHKITHIHPFWEGNGRTARLMANMILERYGLVGISVKIERENKNIYRRALAQIDKHEDYKLLKNLIFDGLSDRYNGIKPKYYSNSNK